MSSSLSDEEIDMGSLFSDLESLLNDYAHQTATLFNQFGYDAITPQEVKNVFSWQRNTDETFSYLQEWCEENTSMNINFAWRLGNVRDHKPPSLVAVMDVVDGRMSWQWNKFYGRKMMGCPYCNVACKEGIYTCGSDECMANNRRDYALARLQK